MYISDYFSFILINLITIVVISNKNPFRRLRDWPKKILHH